MERTPGASYLILDTESVPDGRLLSLVKYAAEEIPPEQAVKRAQDEARARSRGNSDFIQCSYQVPVAVCVIRAAPDFTMQRITCLDAPEYRPAQIVKQFWEGLAQVRGTLVTFNGRGFDLPLLEMAAFRYGVSPGKEYFTHKRPAPDGTHFDILAWLNNYGACFHAGGLNLLAKLLGKPGKMEYRGDHVYAAWQQGKLQEINDYCMYDTLDTYFAFLRTRVMLGEITLEREHEVVVQAKAFLTLKTPEQPGLQKYLDNWGDWQPWP
ncbi:hypothetical protein AYO44_01795 [Planctomycetaceae bacterium SCGC AG-212-F19]|nr:hypothetical protein AYO44_01795 [Planctomycetaceae bacterium SCGC AG-212-F19]